MAPSPPDKVYTMEEAAARLRISRRALQELVKRFPFYALNGNRKLFSEEDLGALWESMRPHSSSIEGHQNRSPTTPSADKMSARVQELIAERTTRPSPQGTKRPRSLK